MKTICVFLSVIMCGLSGSIVFADEQPYIDYNPENEQVFASLLNDDNYQIFQNMPPERRKQCIDMWQGYSETGTDTRPDDIVDRVHTMMEEKQ